MNTPLNITAAEALQKHIDAGTLTRMEWTGTVAAAAASTSTYEEMAKILAGAAARAAGDVPRETREMHADAISAAEYQIVTAILLALETAILSATE